MVENDFTQKLKVDIYIDGPRVNNQKFNSSSIIKGFTILTLISKMNLPYKNYAKNF